METKQSETKVSGKLIIARVAICSAILLFGVLVMVGLGAMKRPPAKKVIKERPVNVEAITAVREDVSVLITGFGEVASLNSVDISPEVSGKVAYIHPNLEMGGIIKMGEVLFKIDPEDYKNSVDVNQKRFKTLKRTLELSKKEYLRTKELFEKSNTGTLSNVESVEQTYNSNKDQLDQIENTLKTARLNLKRCTIAAPFDARVSYVAIEKGQYVTTGSKLTTLSDDSVLEIELPVGSLEAKKYLGFDDNKDSKNIVWFNNIKKTQCEVIWTGDNKTKSRGILDRVIKFDSQTRTVYLAVRIKAGEENSENFPIVDGMFVKVLIPGKTIENVIKVPRNSISYENTVYVSKNNRLLTVPVEVVKTDDDYAIISSGIEPGDIVVTSKLVSPLENALLNVQDKSLVAQRMGDK
ncbi:MAG: efflux RND transporter periplasmic adaptor subunit [Deltaproteobacteria bacterium]|nr:efflux RND transporter periplasmic adaptor subunit [Deltaproteobacteria bacterium]